LLRSTIHRCWIPKTLVVEALQNGEIWCIIIDAFYLMLDIRDCFSYEDVYLKIFGGDIESHVILNHG